MDGPCKDKGERRRNRLSGWWIRRAFPLAGFLAAVWFLVRVIPKPSRATYPCQRVAFPLASGFAIWLAGALASLVAVQKAGKYLREARYILCAALLGIAIGTLWATFFFTDDTPAMADPPVANTPVGEAKGLQPGRVAWIFDPDATDWEGGAGDGNWWFQHIDAAVARRMMSRAIRSYAGMDDEATAWEAIFRHFNRERGKGDVGYQPGQKFAIKLNLVACFAQSGNRVDANYNKTDAWKDNIDNAPELVYGLLEQLVHVVGVEQPDIWIGDSTCLFANYLYDKLHPDFPGVHYWDCRGALGRTRAEYSGNPFYWSKGGTYRQDFVPIAYANAEYVINFAVLKTHDAGGITVCGKNHYGSLIRLPPGDYQDDNGVWHSPPKNPSYYSYHDDLPSNRGGMGHYRNRVEFMGHRDIGGKTILYMIDGILAGKNWNGDPEPWSLPPFDKSRGWPCSLFLSMDPVAIDSVALDFLIQQWPEHAGMDGTADYLVEAALADNPPSGTFYDPNHPGTVSRLSSLGVYEHWNNPIDKQYSRDLDPEGGMGIELLMADDDSTVVARTGTAPAIDGQVDGIWKRTMWRLFPNRIDPLGGGSPDGDDFSGLWKVFWDDGHLYFLVEVTDDRLVHSPEHDDAWWLDDHVTVFIDADNSRGRGAGAPNYDGLNDFEFSFRWGDSEVHTGSYSVPETEGIVFSMVETDSGCRLEAAVPWSLLRARPDSLTGIAAGTRIALDVQIGDSDEPGDSDLDFKLAWSSQLDETFRDASLLATVQLSRDYGLSGTLVERGSRWRYFKGNEAASDPLEHWRVFHFDDSEWDEGPAPFGYGDPPFGTELADMKDRYSTVFLRQKFDVPQGISITGLSITADYDDGFTAWINGREVLRVNVDDGVNRHDEFASGGHESGVYRRFSLPEPFDYLNGGENVLAVQCFNVGLDSTDLKLDLELTYKASTSEIPAGAIFVRGDSNGDGELDISDVIHMLFAQFTGTVQGDCDDARDVDDSGSLDVTDPMALLEFLFRGGNPPLAPFPGPGGDPSDDPLGCERVR